MKRVAVGSAAALLTLPMTLVLLATAATHVAQGAAASGAVAYALDRPPSGFAVADIPPEMLELYRSVAAGCEGLPWQVLAAVGKVETDHGQNVAVSSAGARGPMQFMPATWAAYGTDGNGDGVADIENLADAVASAARYLCANGAGDPSRLRGALLRYNPASWYVDLVLEYAARYAQPPAQTAAAETVADLLARPNLVLTERARADLVAGVVDGRLVRALQVLVARHQISISVFKSGHSKFVSGTSSVSNHWYGRAADVYAVDGVAVKRRNVSARQVVFELLDLPTPPDEIGQPWPDLEVYPGVFSDGDHQGHLHLGYDG